MGGRYFLYLPKNRLTDSQFPLPPGKKVTVLISKSRLPIQSEDEEEDYEYICVPRKLYIKFNKLPKETVAPYRNPEDYIIKHLREVVERHEEWKREMKEGRNGGGRDNSESYKWGFEDSVELCLFEVSRTKSLNEAKKRVEENWSLIKKDKIECIKRMLWQIER